jgi:alpha-L-rhamnosidase
VHVYDFGQNFSGWARLKVTGPAGTRVRMRHAELIYDDGTLNVENLREARATDVYILKGSGEQEVYEPRFTYHGFRYLELTGFPGTPSLDTVVGRVVNSDVKTTGGFTASKPLLNQLQRIIRWGTLSNLHSVPTDCNQRDERMGWMADAHLVAETAILNFDMAAIYSNFVRLMRDDQEKDGSVPDTVPRARFASGPADPAWGSAYPLFIDYMWKHYGDRRLLEEHFDGIKAWADFLNSRARDGILDFVKFGDWVPVEKTPGNLVSTVYLYWSADIVARTAEILGKTAEATQYRQLADSIKAAFHKKFYRPETGDYGNGSQSSNVLPLFTGMVPREVAGRVNGTLINNIVYKDNTHLTTGILGTKYLFPYLTSRGRSDLAYELATQTTYPSWGYMIENGATTLWELWQNKTGPSMNSHNHPMFGSVGAWMYEALAGINAAAPGYARVRIQPQVVRDLKFASGSIESVRGRIASSWHRTSDGLKLDVIIPHGSTAEIHFPKLNLRDITIKDNDRVVWANGSAVGGNGITGGKESSNWLILEAGSGSYSFTLAGN